MAAVTAAVVTGAVSAYGANKQAGAAKDAANAQSRAGQLGIDEQRRQFDTFQGNIQPYLQTGGMANSQLQALLGGDMSGFKADPGYQFRLDQGMQAKDRGAAARGGLFSGGHQADLATFNQGLAAQEYGSYWDRLMGATQLGQNSAVGAGQLGQQSANSIGNLYGNIGNAQAGGAINSANAWSNGLAGIAGAVGQYAGARSSAYQAPQGNYGAFTPTNNSTAWTGALGPSNGSNWNFG